MKKVWRDVSVAMVVLFGVAASFAANSAADDESWCRVVVDPAGDNDPTAPDGVAIDLSSDDSNLLVRIRLASDAVLDGSDWYRVVFEVPDGGGTSWLVDAETYESGPPTFELMKSSGSISQTLVRGDLVGRFDGPDIVVVVPLGSGGMPEGEYSVSATLMHKVVDQPGITVQPFFDQMQAGDYTTGTQCASANLESSQQSGQVPYIAYFDASKSLGGSGIEGYIFDFGDGGAKVLTGQPFVEHVYVSPGSYLATVQVVHKDGSISSPAVSPIEVRASTNAGSLGFVALMLLAVFGVVKRTL